MGTHRNRSGRNASGSRQRSRCLGVGAVSINLRSIMTRAIQLALLIIAGILAAFVVVEYSHAAWVPAPRWLGLIVFTPLVFGAVVRDFRRSWGRTTFWLCVTGLLVAHGAAYTAVLKTVEEWRNVWFLPLSIGECPVLVVVLHSLGYDDRPTPPRHSTNTV
jgi:hypothetical protein